MAAGEPNQSSWPGLPKETRQNLPGDTYTLGPLLSVRTLKNHDSNSTEPDHAGRI
jgi:hypothetical protein